MPVSDEAKKRLVDYFAHHPSWISAAKPLGDGVCSSVKFTGEGQAWRLIRQEGKSVLETGLSENPDFDFTFSEGAIYYLTELEDGSIGDFATRFYECCFLLDEERRVEFQVVSGVGQILKRGYWKIALKGGLKVLKIARQHNLGGVNDVRRLFGLLRGKPSADVREAILAARGTTTIES